MEHQPGTPPRDHRRPAQGHRPAAGPGLLRRRPGPLRARRSTRSWRTWPQGGVGVQGGAGRLRLRQDVLRPLAPGARQAEGLRHRRGPDLRDRDAAAPAGDRLPPAMERLSTADCFLGAFRSVVDGWFYGLEEDVLAEGGDRRRRDEAALARRRRGAAGAAARRRSPGPRPSSPPPCGRYRTAQRRGRPRHRRGAGRLAGRASRTSPPRSSGSAGVKGDVDHFAALSFLRGLLPDPARTRATRGWCSCSTRSRRSSGSGATCGRRGSTPCASSSTRSTPGGSPACTCSSPARRPSSTGRRGSGGWSRWPSGCTWTSRPTPASTTPVPSSSGCPPSTTTGWWRSAVKVRDLYATRLLVAASGSGAWPTTPTSRTLARAVAGKLGGKVGIAPRLFLKKLVADVLDRIDQFDDFDPRQHYRLTVTPAS